MLVKIFITIIVCYQRLVK